MASLNLTDASRAGVAPGLQAVNGGGDSFPLTSPSQKFHFKNTDVADRTVTITAQSPCNQGVLHDAEITVPAGAERIVDDLDPRFYADANGRVQLTYDAATGLTVASYA